MEIDQDFESAVFPDNIARTSNKNSAPTHPPIIFKNFRIQNKDTLSCAFVDSNATEESQRMHLEQVEAIEKMYARKAQKAIKFLAKVESDPLSYLVPNKENENVDLKR